MVLTDQPLKEVLQKMITSGRMVKLSIELSKFSLAFRPKKAIKAQTLADFSSNAYSSVNQSKKSKLARVKERLLKRVPM